jgi:hypothetical protein
MKTGQVTLRGWMKEGSTEYEYGWYTFYTRMNTKYLSLLKSS